MIDNSENVYIPFHLKCGLTAQCSLEVFDVVPQILDVIEKDVFNCIKALPASVHELVRRTNIWINVTYSYGQSDHPTVLKHTAAHHYEKWLICTKDIPEKVLGIEIYNCFEYLQNRNHWNGCGLLLHEFCHLIHQLVLPDGLSNQDVKNMYGLAMKSKKYQEVLRRDWAYLPCDKDTAYATINHKEFFAELSVAFLSSGHEHLDVVEDFNKSMPISMDSVSPPFQSTDILNRQQLKDSSHNNNRMMNNYSFQSFLLNLIKSIWTQQESHCNKFFPFTKNQLRSYDSDTFTHVAKCWASITQWKDPCSTEPCWKTIGCWKGRRVENKMEENLLSNDFTAQNYLSERMESNILDTVDL